MLYLIGTGVNEYDSLSLDSISVLQKSDFIFIERFTGYLSNSFINQIYSILSSFPGTGEKSPELKIVNRWFVEDGRDILQKSRDNNVSILIYGDPLIATTYIELLVRAKKQSVNYKIIHSSSGISTLIGESGLHPYKFGKMVTMMSDPMSSITVYNTIYGNICLGLHTLILTEYRYDDKKNHHNDKNNEAFFLSPIKAIELLLDRESEFKLLNLSKESFIIIASKVGTDRSQIKSGKIKSFLKSEFENGHTSIIVPGSLHFTEIDSIRNLTLLMDDPIDNSSKIEKVSNKMLDKYIPNAKIALSNLNDLLKAEEWSHKKDYSTVLENAENYLFDAEIFYKQGKHELAILSVGYAEGLIDSIRFQKGLNPW
ncbi:MAG: diphthine synthase [Thermoproteota archaeon]|nr:diphthine synthase [Thermoproteota archaeon]